jgi:hypothetical protein
MNKKVQIRRLLALATTGVAAVALALTGSASASGGTHTQTSTDNFHGTQTSTVENPCTGNALDLTQISNIVFHMTWFPAGDELWTTYTEEDKSTAVDELTGVTYTGHGTFWGNANINRQSANWTFTSNLEVKGSDGSTIASHEVGHVTVLPDNSVSVAFDKPSLTCTY